MRIEISHFCLFSNNKKKIQLFLNSKQIIFGFTKNKINTT